MASQGMWIGLYRRDTSFEVVALKIMTHREVIEFITKYITHKFDIPRTLTTDQGTSFMSKEVCEFAESYRIKLLYSSPYFAQANG